MITVSICTIGDELLIGQVLDTNTALLSARLNSLGLRVVRHLGTGDAAQDIEDTLRTALAVSDLVILTGGLGPTKDDITKQVLYHFTGAQAWVSHPGQEAVIQRICQARNMPYSGLNQDQARVPDSCTVIVNNLGTAPAMWFPLAQGKALVSLPGVPFEVKGLLDNLCAHITEHFALEPNQHLTLCTIGMAESALARHLEAWEEALPAGLHLAYLPDPLRGVRLRLSAYGKEVSPSLFQEYSASLRQCLGPLCYGQGEDDLPTAVAQALLSRGATVSTAESCTGGRLAQLFTRQAGASTYYHGSVVSYHNSVKEQVLGVDPAVIQTYGAVSQACVEQMATGVRERLATTYSVATSGIAGPGGGSPEKPVGTVWIAASGPGGTVSEQHRFTGPRDLLIDRFAAVALDLLRRQILADKQRFLL